MTVVSRAWQAELSLYYCMQYHLALLCCLLDLSNDLFVLILQGHALTVKLPNGFVQHTLVFPQKFCFGQRQNLTGWNRE